MTRISISISKDSPALHPTPRSKRRAWPRLAWLAFAVALVHAWLVNAIGSHMQDSATGADTAIQRMEAVYVDTLSLSTPPAAAVAATPKAPAVRPRPRPRPAAPQSPASSPKTEALDEASKVETSPPPDTQLAASAPPPPEVLAAASSPPSSSSAQAVSAASSAGKATLAAPQSQPFVWPRATRVNYKMEGYWRGPVYGQAVVEWVRQDNRYQTHLGATIGPRLFPAGSLSLISEGLITADGLAPRRYEQTTRVLLGGGTPQTVKFNDPFVVLTNGEQVPYVQGMQDAVSQFIQLAYRFITHPELLQTGQTVELPLVVPKKSLVLAYDVMEQETLATPVGQVPAFHLKPRVVQEGQGLLPAEIWFAPGLQYLPVRILVHIDDTTYMDMRMDQAPQQTGAADNPSSAASAP